jgi:UDP-N-acetylglucosamine--N-acetylmuramyl-(pentapeptide) pyrophosphoryl-undecaprenol N-acetylglucosamine transferase
MKILLCGGGTGGHITPILSIAHEIKRRDPEAIVIYVGEHGGKFKHLVKNQTSIDSVKTIFGGKLRRYHKESWFKRITSVKTNLLNLRDAFYIPIGFVQSLGLIIRQRPDVIFIKGGYVGLPVGFAAALTHTRYITHDSDALPSLTTKVVGKWATYNATGMPVELYPYDKAKLRFVGIPVSANYELVSYDDIRKNRQLIDIPTKAKLLLIIGGSLGSKTLNEAVAAIIPKLLSTYPDLYIIAQVGEGNSSLYDHVLDPRLRVNEFFSDLYKYSAAADLIITRGGATTIAELSAQGKAAIVVPNPLLTGGHQVKNAQQLANENAAVVISQEDSVNKPEEFYNVVADLLNNPLKLEKLGSQIHQVNKLDATGEIVDLLFKSAVK